MRLEELARQSDEWLTGTEEVETASPIPGILLLRHQRRTQLEASLYEPVICLILRGEKETSVGERTVRFGVGEALLVSHDVPVVSRITQASPAAPYLALVFKLDMGILRGLYDQLPAGNGQAEPGDSFDVRVAEPALVDAFGRYLALAKDEVDARVLGPLLQKEIHYRLARAPQGAMLRKLLHNGSHASCIQRAIAHVRSEFKQNIEIPALARSVGMSTSAFHKHFKAITTTTPLQYQKELRLLEAKRLLSVEGYSVSDAAFDVGYESPTQFSREFARKFGTSPSKARTAA